MKAAYAIHLITSANDSVAPGSVFEVDETEFDRLRSKGAVRKPTPEELALYEMQKPKPVDAPKSEKKAPAAPKAQAPEAPTSAETEAKIAAAKSEEAEKAELVRVLTDAGKKPHPNTGLEKLRKAVADLEPENLDLTGE